MLVNSDERIDDLLINNLKIIQSDKEFRFAIDAILLANFATLRQKATVVDLGTGTGVMALLMKAYGADKVFGIEISNTMADMAQRSVALNGLNNDISILQGDYKDIKKYLPSGQFDLVIANPPYRPVGAGKINPNDKVAIARHELTATLQDVIGAARYLLKYRGRFSMVHLPERMPEIMHGMIDAGLEPKRLRLVHSMENKKPSLLLIEGVRGANKGLEVLPPLVIYSDDGSYSKEIMSYYEN